jgi:outer membrane protein assembly factor BamB
MKSKSTASNPVNWRPVSLALCLAVAWAATSAEALAAGGGTVITFKLVKQAAGMARTTPEVRLLTAGEQWTVHRGVSWCGENLWEIFFTVETQDAKTPLPQVAVTAPGIVPVRAIVGKTDVPFTRAGDTTTFTLARDTSNAMLLNQSFPDSEGGRPVGIYHNWMMRQDGSFRGRPAPQVEVRAVLNYLFAAREAMKLIKAAGFDAEKAFHGEISLLGFEVACGRGHVDFPPHVHIMLYVPGYVGGEVPHFYMDAAGRIVSNSFGILGDPTGRFPERRAIIAEKQKRGGVYGPGKPCRMYDLENRLGIELTITPDGGLLLTQGGHTYLLIGDTHGPGEAVLVKQGDRALVRVRVDDDAVRGETRAVIEYLRDGHVTRTLRQSQRYDPFTGLTPKPANDGAAWPQFRGPLGNGLATDARPPVEWSETKNVKWKAPVPGRGRSSPVLWGDRIWLTTAREQGVRRTRIEGDDVQLADRVSLGAVCLGRDDGRLLFDQTLFSVEKPGPAHWHNSWATPTPVVEPGRLYCDFGTYGTACLDSQTGKPLWKTRLAIDHQLGPGSSPVLCGDRLVLVRDGRDAQYVAALDKRTGQTQWKTNRPPIEAKVSNWKKSFSTPLLITVNGRQQLVVPGPQWFVAYDPASGQEVWRVHHGRGFSIAARPVFGHGLVYLCTGAIRPELWAVRVDGHGDVTDTHMAWKTRAGVPTMSSPILVGDLLYLVSDAGIASCFNAKTGESLWRERLPGTYLASPISAADRVYFCNRDGLTSVVKLGREFARLAENRLDGTLVATPALVDRSVFLRTDSHLYRIEATP